MQTNSRFAVAIHILTILAYQCEEPVTSERIAQSVITNPVVIRRTLGDLRRAGLVLSQPGQRGGWQLSRHPEEITLLEAYRAVQTGLPFAFPPQSPNPNCAVGQHILTALTGVFEDVAQAMEQEMARITVRDVLDRVRNTPCASLSSPA